MPAVRLLFALFLLAQLAPAFGQSAVTGGTGSSDCIIGCDNAPLSAPDLNKMGSTAGAYCADDKVSHAKRPFAYQRDAGLCRKPLSAAGRVARRRDRGARDGGRS